MLSPAARQFLIDNSPAIEQLSRTFGNYSPGITKTNVEHFISQFRDEHLSLSLKLLENVDYYDSPIVTTLARDLGNQIKALTNPNLDNVLICPIKPVFGTSTESIQRKLRQTMASNASERNHISQKIINYIDLQGLANDSQQKTIFFVDDFIGSGDTVIRSWGRTQIWENDNHSYFVGVLVAYGDAIARIEEETGNHFEIIRSKELSENDRVFHPNNRIFTDAEKHILKSYCEALPNAREHRYGHRNGQSLVVFSEMCPNNTLPILHQQSTSPQWTPLFPRYF